MRSRPPSRPRSSGALGADADALRDELAAVDEMLAIAESAKTRPDARVRWLTSWIFENLLDRMGSAGTTAA